MTSAAAQAAAGDPDVVESKHLQVVRRFLDQVNAYEWEAVTAMVPDRLSSSLTSLWLGNPNLHITTEWMECHGDRVTVWSYGTGTHTRDWQLPPTVGSFAGRKVCSTGTSWRVPWSVTFKVRKERIVDVWGVWDWLSILLQLGVVRLASGSRPVAG